MAAAALPRALRPMRHADYRWLAACLVLSLTATGLWTVALVWQIVALGGGPRQLSIVVAAGSAGMLATALIGGVLADRLPQRWILFAVAVVQGASIGAVALLSLTARLSLWHLVVVAAIGGVAEGLFYPAYSALLPTLVHADDLLAANGVEGVLRPVMLQAAGPAAASALVAAASPGTALAAASLAAGASALALLPLRGGPRALSAQHGPRGGHPVAALLWDVREGLGYMARTPWLQATLLFASLMVLLTLGPFEVLIPFAIKDVAGGGPAQHALVLAAFGIGGAAGSLAVASIRLPRRYLTVMSLMWAVGCMPMVLFGITTRVEVMVAAALVVGALFNGGVVIWGTLLQRRVPAHLLGRVSSLDFFVSLLFMPVSMALAGPAADTIGLRATFLIAGLAPLVVAVIVLLVARLPADEVANPLDRGRPHADHQAGTCTRSERVSRTP